MFSFLDIFQRLQEWAILENKNGRFFTIWIILAGNIIERLVTNNMPKIFFFNNSLVLSIRHIQSTRERLWVFLHDARSDSVKWFGCTGSSEPLDRLNRQTWLRLPRLQAHLKIEVWTGYWLRAASWCSRAPLCSTYFPFYYLNGCE